MATKTIILTGEEQDIERALAELKSNIDYERIPVKVQVKKEKK